MDAPEIVRGAARDNFWRGLQAGADGDYYQELEPRQRAVKTHLVGTR